MYIYKTILRYYSLFVLFVDDISRGHGLEHLSALLDILKEETASSEAQLKDEQEKRVRYKVTIPLNTLLMLFLPIFLV